MRRYEFKLDLGEVDFAFDSGDDLDNAKLTVTTYREGTSCKVEMDLDAAEKLQEFLAMALKANAR
jgi:hypothetical protein